MNVFFSINSLKLFSLGLLMVLSTVVYATEGTKDNGKDTEKKPDKEQVDQGQSLVDNSSSEQPTQEKAAKEEEGMSISSVSFNFIFYLIYKIKYADIFKIVNRKQDESNSSVWSQINLNHLYRKLAPPAI